MKPLALILLLALAVSFTIWLYYKLRGPKDPPPGWDGYYWSIALMCLLFLTGCTVRGGWPRFLRWGEASDRTMRLETEKQLKAMTNAPVKP